MSDEKTPLRRKKSVVLDGAVAMTILAIIVSAMGRSPSLLSLVGFIWLLYGLGVFIKRFGKLGLIIVMTGLLSISGWIYYLYRTGLPKRELYAQIHDLGACAVHTDGPPWAPESRFVLFDERVGDEEVIRFTELRGLTDLKHVHFNGSKITDAALGRLAKLSQLREIGFRDVAITLEGIELLHQQLPDCEIRVE